MAVTVGTALIGRPVHERKLGFEVEAGLRLSQHHLRPASRYGSCCQDAIVAFGNQKGRGGQLGKAWPAPGARVAEDDGHTDNTALQA